jgi:Fe-S cluster assembly ATPase SufC
MSFKKQLMKQGMALFNDPRVQKVISDPRVMQGVMQVMAVPGKVQEIAEDGATRVAKAMNIATQDEVKDLKRTIRRLEDEVHRQGRDLDRELDRNK